MFASLPGRTLGRRNDTCVYCDKQAPCMLYQGETDSFGYETVAVCTDCEPRYEAEKAKEKEGNCDWCKAPSTDLRWTRDYEESGGPVYKVCPACRKRQREAIMEETLYDNYRKNDRCGECNQRMTFAEFKSGSKCDYCR